MKDLNLRHLESCWGEAVVWGSKMAPCSQWPQLCFSASPVKRIWNAWYLIGCPPPIKTTGLDGSKVRTKHCNLASVRCSIHTPHPHPPLFPRYRLWVFIFCPLQRHVQELWELETGWLEDIKLEGWIWMPLSKLCSIRVPNKTYWMYLITSCSLRETQVLSLA